MTEVIGPRSRVVSVRRLRPGGWHVNHALNVVDGSGGTHRLVLRRWARPGWETDDPDYTVERETRVLGLLGPTPVPAPVVAADPTGAHCDVPAIILTCLPGHPPRPADSSGGSFFRQLAETLATIHDVGSAAGACWFRTAYTTIAQARHPPAGWAAGGSGHR
ncbi:MAG TPA: phosphotransferase [Streptosporangiaceae bacterium]|nr:phosphotransferase [Streptosporangiaceae bacterium]